MNSPEHLARRTLNRLEDVMHGQWFVDTSGTPLSIAYAQANLYAVAERRLQGNEAAYALGFAQASLHAAGVLSESDIQRINYRSL